MTIPILYMTNQGTMDLYGGAETQMIKMRQCINGQKAGKVRVELFDMWHDRIEDYRIIHLFKPWAFPSESLSLARFAAERGLRVVVTPIKYDIGAFGRENLNFVRNLFEKSGNPIRRFLSKTKVLQYINPDRHLEMLFEACDAILPNTEKELEWLLQHYVHIDPRRCDVIPNGVDERFKHGDPSLFEERTGLSEFILFVGRIEKRKNLLRLIKAFVRSDLDTHLVIIGRVTDSCYYQDCVKEASDKVVFLPPVDHESEILASAYKAAKVVALPSYFETPGLSALEGGIAGANLVITSEGGTREYFGNYAHYVNPLMEDEIGKALAEAYERPKNHELSDLIEERFTWNCVARKQTKVYENLCEHGEGEGGV